MRCPLFEPHSFVLIWGLLGEALAEVLATFTASKNGLQPVAQTPAGSVTAQLNVIDRLEVSQNGSFISTSSI